MQLGITSAMEIFNELKTFPLHLVTGYKSKLEYSIDSFYKSCLIYIHLYSSNLKATNFDILAQSINWINPLVVYTIFPSCKSTLVEEETNTGAMTMTISQLGVGLERRPELLFRASI